MRVSILKSWKNLDEIEAGKDSFGQLKYVYIFERSRNLIKVGVAKHPYARARNIITGSGLPLRRAAFSGPYFRAERAERLALSMFEDKRIPGSEWIRLPFAEAIATLAGLPEPEANPSSGELREMRKAEVMLRYGDIINTKLDKGLGAAEPWALVCWNTEPPTYVVSECPKEFEEDFMAGFSEDSPDDGLGRLSVSACSIEQAEKIGAVRVA